MTLKTDLGRGFTMIYAFIGIPLVLMVLTDLGKLFTRAIKTVFLAIRRFLYAHGLRKVKRASRRVAPTQVINDLVIISIIVKSEKVTSLQRIYFVSFCQTFQRNTF